MSLAVTIKSIEDSGNVLRVGFNLAASGTYTTGVGGDTLDFTSATQDDLYQGPAAALPVSSVPLSLRVASQGGQIKYQYVPTVGTTQATCKLTVISAFNTELGTGAYPSEVTGDSIDCEATFTKGI